ncbi:MAG TPA: asparagine synthase-related protein, partial [Burkholderiales bacterium]|nr:asparagine synthase-related protein [Burkholderiales bacterium]
MSGICGWAQSDAPHAVIGAMAARLKRFNGAPCKTAFRNGAAVAAAGCAEVHEGEAWLIAVSGALEFTSPALSTYSGTQGPARALATHYPKMGPDILRLCSGAFSLALVGRDEALLATDRMGIHPLIYICAGDALVFGSSLDAINLHPLVRSNLNRQAIYNYLYFHMVPGPETIYSGQKRLLPGEYLHFRNGKCVVASYWQMAFAENRRAPFVELKTQFVSTLKESVLKAAEGVQTGTFLSGGTDSSTLAGLLTQVTAEPARTYSIGFAEAGYDEMRYARIAAKHFGTRHNEYYVTPDDIVNAIPRIAEVHDQPFGNSSAVPTYYCAQMAKQDGVERLLGGDGGDELFGGNERYAKQTVFSRYEKVPLTIRKFALEPAVAAAGEAFALTRKAKSYIDQASMPMPARLETYNLLEHFGAEQVFTADFLASVDTHQPLALLESAYYGTNAQSLINRMLALDFKFTLADNDLPKVIRSCELAAVDVRFPMLADSVVAFSSTLAPELKLKGTKLRWFFK